MPRSLLLVTFDTGGDVVVRLYEAHGGRASARVTASFDVTSITVTDLLERPLSESGPELSLRPFEIVTLRLGRGRD